MAKETHIITISPKGAVKIEVRGVKGRSCQDATRALEEALGDVVSEDLTSEFYEQPNKNIVQNRA
jgi:beta-lactam-binding protein with PASTA domain